MNDHPPEVLPIRCKHCNAMNLVPKPADVDLSGVLKMKLAELLAGLSRNTKDPATIGKRVQQLEFAMNAKRERGALLTFARQQKIASAGASRAITEAEGQLQKLVSVTKDSTAKISG